MDARENWESAQAYLYYELGQQMRQLWHNGNGAALHGAGGAESHIERPPEPTPVSGSGTTAEHWCAEHETAYTRKNGKGGESWYSHKAPDGSWCRE